MADVLERNEALGIHQSDIVIRTALIAGLNDLRSNAFLLDFVFSSLPEDNLTNQDYGQKQVQLAKKWFLETDIPVVMNVRLADAKMPCVSIVLLSSAEDENSLADIHYLPTQEVGGYWPIISGTFTPTTFDSKTGQMVIPKSVTNAIELSTQMCIITKVGKAYPILDVLDRDTVLIKPGTIDDFGQALIKGQPTGFLIHLESAKFREQYMVGCHVNTEPVHLTYLHSIITFILLSYREALLEARGFERSFISSSDFQRNEAFDQESVYSRFVTLTGSVTNYWPKKIVPKTTSVDTQFAVIGGNNYPPKDIPANLTPDDLGWMGDLDALALGKLGK